MAHSGSDNLVKFLYSKGWKWGGMWVAARDTVDACFECSRRNRHRMAAALNRKPFNAAAPMDHLVMDLVTMPQDMKMGAKFALIVVDVASRFLWIIPLSAIRSTTGTAAV